MREYLSDFADHWGRRDEWGQVLNAEGFIPARRESSFALGLDVGQTIDPTAISIVERIRDPIPPPAGIGADLVQQLGPPRYECRHLERLPLQTSYPAVVNYVGAMLARPALRGRCALVVDQTGVGRPIVDMFAALDPVAVTITSGDHERRERGTGGFRVAKLMLVSRLQAVLHARELRIAKTLSEAGVLAMELANFRASISESGYASFGARVGKHDDLVLAMALAVWWLTGGAAHNSYTVEPLPIG